MGPWEGKAWILGSHCTNAPEQPALQGLYLDSRQSGENRAPKRQEAVDSVESQAGLLEGRPWRKCRLLLSCAGEDRAASPLAAP